MSQTEQPGARLNEALRFAIAAHAGMVRKQEARPYILHPLEVTAIAGTITGDEDVLCAAVLHDTVEDTTVTPQQIQAAFGLRVAALVASETENKRPELPPDESWLVRKQESLAALRQAEDPGVAMLWLSDKLSNMRAFYRSWLTQGHALWQSFNQKDPAKQAWYYRTIADYTRALAHTAAWQEYNKLVQIVFEGIE